MALAALRRSLIPVGAVLASATLVLVAAAPAQAAGTNLVVNGNFASPADGGFISTPPGIPGWTASGGQPNFEIVSAVTITPPAGSAPGTQSIDLNVDSPEFIVSSLMSPVAGHAYTLSFDLAGNPNGVAVGSPAVKTGTFQINQVQVGTLDFDTTNRSGTNMGWVHKSVVFTATNGLELRFLSTTPGAYGPVITNVSVVEVPEAGGPLADWPIALVTLLGLVALLAVGVVLRRRGSATTA